MRRGIIAILLFTGIIVSISAVSAADYDFGGIYGSLRYTEDGQTKTQEFKNPATDKLECPSGYGSSLIGAQFFGNAQQEIDAVTGLANLFLCYKSRTSGSSALDFGGMYITRIKDGVVSNYNKNPITGDECPSGYGSQTIRIISREGYQPTYQLNVCYKKPGINSPTDYFGGAFSNSIVSGTPPKTNSVFNNPLTGSLSCPAEYSKESWTNIMSLGNVENNEEIQSDLSFCYRTVGLTNPVNNVQIKCSDPTQTIFRISSENNAHAQSPTSAGAYDIEICYDSLFKKVYSGANKQICAPTTNPTNKVIRLSSLTNAHAENPSKSTAGYSNICYGDLSCKLVATSIGCNTIDKEIPTAFLSSDSNAHISNNAGSGYGFVLCCKSPSSNVPVNNPPYVSITSPSNNARFSVGSNINIVAQSGDPDPGDSVTSVKFYKGSELIGQGVKQPNSDNYAFNWLENLPIGNYVLKAVAYDSRNAYKFSDPVTIFVDGPSCSDGIENGNEEGIDCGGSCPNQCVGNGVCGDGIRQQPNSAGFNEGCDKGPPNGAGPNCLAGCISSFVATKCEDYNSFPLADRKIKCNEDNEDRDDVSCPDSDIACSECKGCIWDDESCNLKILVRGGNECINPSGCTTSTCVASYNYQGQCIDGQRKVTINYKKLSGTCSCSNQITKTVPCGRNVVALPFFGIWQALGVIVIIGVLYYVMFANKSGRKGKLKK